MNLRYLWRSVSLVFVLWFALFPTLSYASETAINETYTYDWREAERELMEYSQSTGSSTTWSIKDNEVTSGYLNSSIMMETTSWVPIMNVSMGTYLPPYTFSTGTSMNSTMHNIWKNNNADIRAYVSFLNKSGNILFEKDDICTVSISGLFLAYHNAYSWSIPNYGGGSSTYAEPFDLSQLTYAAFRINDNSNLNINVTDFITINGDTLGVNAESIQFPEDVYKLTLLLNFSSSADDLDSSKTHEGFRNWANSGIYEFRFIDSTFSIEYEDKNTGLLSGIIEWLRSIRDGIVNVGSGVTNVFNSIIELPSRIWTFIQEGLKMLFIPSEQDISNMHNQWDELMRDRFGAIYESGDIVHSFADTMNVNSAMVADTGGVITMPSVTANLAGTDFTFGGYEVDLVPDGFQWLVTTLKMLINIVCTILFINALKGKIEVLLR